jgi:hypothetical protein
MSAGLMSGCHLEFCLNWCEIELVLYFTSINQFVKFGSNPWRIVPGNVWKPFFALCLVAILDFAKFVQTILVHDAMLVKAINVKYDENPAITCRDMTPDKWMDRHMAAILNFGWFSRKSNLGCILHP